MSGTTTRIVPVWRLPAELRPTLSTLSVSGTTRYQSQTSYDAIGNVVAVSTTLQAGTDNQAFCYDELNRLTWAGASGTPPCGGSLTQGALTSAAYTQSYSYDDLNRLTSGPAGSSYTYGSSAHLDASRVVVAHLPVHVIALATFSELASGVQPTHENDDPSPDMEQVGPV